MTDLRELVLRALVVGRGETAWIEQTGFGPVAVCAERAYVLLGDAPHRSVGAAVAWVLRRELAELDLVLNGPAHAPAVEVRSQGFVRPTIRLWLIDGRQLVPLATTPRPRSSPTRDDPAAAAARARVEAHGIEIVTEHGVTTGEVEGLEVVRIEMVDGTAELAIGVGGADREINDVLTADGGQGVDERLAATVALVRSYRMAGAAPHPLNTLARERWLRSALIADPARIGCAELHHVAPLEARSGLRAPAPAPAAGRSREGRPVVVVCSVGVDPDLVPVAAALRERVGPPKAELIVVVPTGDDYRITRELVGAVRAPARLVAIEPPWRVVA